MKKLFIVICLLILSSCSSNHHRGHYHTVIIDRGFGLIERWQEVKDSNNVFNVTITLFNKGLDDIYLAKDTICECGKINKIMASDSTIINAEYTQFTKKGFDFEVYKYVYIGKKINFTQSNVIGVYCEEENKMVN